MRNKQRIFIFLTHHNSGIPILPYYSMVESLRSGNFKSLATYDLNYFCFDYNSYLVVNNKVVLYNQDLLLNKSCLVQKEIRQSHNAPKLLRAGYFEELIAWNYENNTYPQSILIKGDLCKT